MNGKAKKSLKKLICAGLVILFITASAKATLVNSNSIVQDGIEYYIQTDKAVYDLGEDLEILYRITNLTEEERRFDYMPPLLDILVAAKDGENFITVWFWSWYGIWPTGPAVFRLQPGESVELNGIWPQIDLNGTWEIEDDTQVWPGIYGIGGRIGRSGFNDIIDNSSVTLEIIIIPEPATRTIYVDDDEPADFNNIQAAIDYSNDGDTIIVAHGIYTGPGNRNIDFVGKAVTLSSEDGPDVTTIDCQNSGRGFYFHSGEDANSVLDGFTITHGYASGGGGMLESSSGGIYCNGSSPTIINCIVSENSAVYYGGGMSNYESSPMLINCIFSGNSANSGGGGIFNYDHSSPNLINCILKANSAIGNGGGMNNMHNSNPTIVNCTFNGNSTDMKDGGGMYNHESDPSLINCIFTGNSAYNCGGGIRNDGFDPPPTNNLFRDNWANDENIMSNLGCDLILTNCTFFANSATYGNAMACNSYGGLRPSNVRLTNSILWNGGNEIWNNDNSTIIITYSAVQDGWSGLGNIDTDPCFANPCSDDYHLKSQAGRWDPNEGRWTRDDVTSQCIDAGNPMSPIGYEPFPNGGRVNMGAYGGTEQSSKSYFGQPVCETIVAGDINGDCKVNFLDFRLMALHWLGGEPYIPDIPNKPPVVDIIKPPNGVNICYELVIEIEADASDEDGVVVKVDFFADESKIGEDNDGTDGWKINWQNHSIGVYCLTAKATDNDNAETTSQPVEIILDEDCGEPP